MKFTKKLIAGTVAAATISAAAFAPVANAELSASANVASTYLWRGVDLGSGTPAVSGDLVYSESGFYTGIWGSSGDTTAGTEYDLFAGYGGEAGDFSYDISIWNYLYPEGGTQEDTFGDLSEIIVSVGFGPVSASVYKNITGADYSYYTLGVAFDAFSLTLGADAGDDSTESTHLDLGYAYNDSLSFTLSQMIDDNDDTVDDDLKFVVSYSLPIE